MLGVGTRVRLSLDHSCRRQHARLVNGQVGIIVAVVTDEVLVSGTADPNAPSSRLSIETFAGHLYTVELDEPDGPSLELWAANELEPLPRRDQATSCDPLVIAQG